MLVVGMFKKKAGKKLFLPILLLMSVISLATEIIPLWLFFAIVFPALLTFLDKDEEVNL